MSSTASPSLYCFLYRFLSGKCWKYLQYLISLRCQADADLPHIVRVKHHNRLARITNDSAEYGIIRMVVSNPEHAEKVLAEAGYLCRLTEVLGVELDDEVGALNRLLISLEESNINVDSCISPSIVILASRLWCFTRTM